MDPRVGRGVPPGRRGRPCAVTAADPGAAPRRGGGAGAAAVGASPAEAATARQVLECLRGLPVLAGVHNPAALTDLPEPERQEWQAFWQEVEGLLRGPDPAR